MQVLYGTDFKINNQTAVTLGKFDGLHEGHIKVINKLLCLAAENKLSSVVYTFNTNPKLVLNQEQFIPIMSNEEKSEALSLLGVDYLVYDEFNIEFANMSPEHFVKNILVDKLNTKVVVMGENSTFGKDRNGNVEGMKRFGEKYGFKVEVVELVKKNGEVISSTKIRGKIKLP